MGMYWIGFCIVVGAILVGASAEYAGKRIAEALEKAGNRIAEAIKEKKP